MSQYPSTPSFFNFSPATTMTQPRSIPPTAAVSRTSAVRNTGGVTTSSRPVIVPASPASTIVHDKSVSVGQGSSKLSQTASQILDRHLPLSSPRIAHIPLVCIPNSGAAHATMPLHTSSQLLTDTSNLSSQPVQVPYSQPFPRVQTKVLAEKEEGELSDVYPSKVQMDNQKQTLNKSSIISQIGGQKSKSILDGEIFGNHGKENGTLITQSTPSDNRYFPELNSCSTPDATQQPSARQGTAGLSSERRISNIKMSSTLSEESVLRSTSSDGITNEYLAEQRQRSKKLISELYKNGYGYSDLARESNLDTNFLRGIYTELGIDTEASNAEKHKDASKLHLHDNSKTNQASLEQPHSLLQNSVSTETTNVDGSRPSPRQKSPAIPALSAEASAVTASPKLQQARPTAPITVPILKPASYPLAPPAAPLIHPKRSSAISQSVGATVRVTQSRDDYVARLKALKNKNAPVVEPSTIVISACSAPINPTVPRGIEVSPAVTDSVEKQSVRPATGKEDSVVEIPGSDSAETAGVQPVVPKSKINTEEIRRRLELLKPSTQNTSPFGSGQPSLTEHLESYSERQIVARDSNSAQTTADTCLNWSEPRNTSSFAIDPSSLGFEARIPGLFMTAPLQTIPGVYHVSRKRPPDHQLGIEKPQRMAKRPFGHPRNFWDDAGMIIEVSDDDTEPKDLDENLPVQSLQKSAVAEKFDKRTMSNTKINEKGMTNQTKPDSGQGFTAAQEAQRLKQIEIADMKRQLAILEEKKRAKDMARAPSPVAPRQSLGSVPSTQTPQHEVAFGNSGSFKELQGLPSLNIDTGDAGLPLNNDTKSMQENIKQTLEQHTHSSPTTMSSRKPDNWEAERRAKIEAFTSHFTKLESLRKETRAMEEQVRKEEEEMKRMRCELEEGGIDTEGLTPAEQMETYAQMQSDNRATFSESSSSMALSSPEVEVASVPFTEPQKETSNHVIEGDNASVPGFAGGIVSGIETINGDDTVQDEQHLEDFDKKAIPEGSSRDNARFASSSVDMDMEDLYAPEYREMTSLSVIVQSQDPPNPESLAKSANDDQITSHSPFVLSKSTSVSEVKEGSTLVPVTAVTVSEVPINEATSESDDEYEPPDVTAPVVVSDQPVASTVVSCPDQHSSLLTTAKGPVSDIQEDSMDTSYDAAPTPMKHTMTDLGFFTPYLSPLRLFRAYRYHPDFIKNVIGGFRSNTYSHNIDPQQPLCVFETAGGVCNDNTCDGQHFRDMAVTVFKLTSIVSNMTDNNMLLQLGTDTPTHTEEGKREYLEGLKVLVKDLRARTVNDSAVVASEIANYRRKFLKDSTKVLKL